jgi:hypothetical protein
MILWPINPFKYYPWQYPFVIIWNICELFHIGLGKLAPVLFGIITQTKGKRIE